MKVKNIISEDFINYKKPAMFIAAPSCSFKCDLEAGSQVCQNCELAKSPTFEIDDTKIIKRYLDNDISEAIVFGGLEPFDNFNEIYEFIWRFTRVCQDDIVIYTGYNPSEIKDKLKKLYKFRHLFIKFGRFIPNDKSRHDEVIGVTLASSNQFAMSIEDIQRQMEE